ncbi:bleomycin hydrolase [Coccinella septempunctata]|uniref:bleomycin hydrolase n=1 Tax=Coccinella septempunctata TaxID=41139 RepID=UPI001D08467A|nr:bleomycin hydrolase [Coccinella septempunctata]
MEVELNKSIIDGFRNKFYEDKTNILALNVCSRTDPFDVCLSRKEIEETVHVFSHKVECEGKPVTNQKNTGRCWLFSALNAMRIPFIKSQNLEDFEFSQSYLFYWDKIERANYFLNAIVETARRKEPVDGRLVCFLFENAVPDGGQWDMVHNLVVKHGLMPKKCFPETYSSETSLKMNRLLRSKLREYAKVLRDMVEKDESVENIQKKIVAQMEVIYRIVGICLGVPNQQFTWTYYDKNKQFHKIGPITAVEFYEKYVKPVFNMDDKVCLVADPRPFNEYGKTYAVEFLNNMVGGRPCIYNNQPIQLLLEVTGKSIKSGEAVWFGCDVSKRFANKQGLLDLKVHDFPLVFGVDCHNDLCKADRLIYGESSVTHAMVFTAVDVDEEGKIAKLRVENSWGDDKGEKGYLLMTSDWFMEYNFEVVVDKKHVPPEVLETAKLEPIILPAWDPIGTLARECQI